jgi:hypothetical protein
MNIFMNTYVVGRHCSSVDYDMGAEKVMAL